MDYAKKIVYQSNYWYNDGLRKAQIRDMSGAAKSLRISLQFNRENIAARNLLGLVYYGTGEVAEALVEWIISKNLRPRDNIANYFIKEVQASANELETINQAVKKYNQCIGYCRQNGEDLAIIQLKQVITSHPSFLKAHQLLALLYLRTEQYSRARQVLRAARRIDTANETTLRYMHEMTARRGRGRRIEKKKKDDAVEYSLGNETIIQPKHSTVKSMASHLAVANIFIGAAIGAAIIWFLVAPAVNQSRSERLNNQIGNTVSRLIPWKLRSAPRPELWITIARKVKAPRRTPRRRPILLTVMRILWQLWKNTDRARMNPTLWPIPCLVFQEIILEITGKPSMMT